MTKEKKNSMSETLQVIREGDQKSFIKPLNCILFLSGARFGHRNFCIFSLLNNKLPNVFYFFN